LNWQFGPDIPLLQNAAPVRFRHHAQLTNAAGQALCHRPGADAPKEQGGASPLVFPSVFEEHGSALPS